MPSDSSVIVLSKPEQKADFGSALHVTMCPECQKYLKWKAIDAWGDPQPPGILSATCCGREFEMYSEVATIKMISGRPFPAVNARERHHAQVMGART